jgi:hypothetical protein
MPPTITYTLTSAYLFCAVYLAWLVHVFVG